MKFLEDLLERCLQEYVDYQEEKLGDEVKRQWESIKTSRTA